MISVAINGYGRIGRCIVRALVEAGLGDSIKVIAINELADPETICYLTRYDSTHGRFPGVVKLSDTDNPAGRGNRLLINGQEILLLREQNVAELPWKRLGVDLVFECTGSFSDRSTAERHLAAGAKRVLFSQPADRDVDATIVYGINESLLDKQAKILSAASCTTNAVVPVIDCLERGQGIESGMIRTLHAAMHDQPVIDAYHHSDLRKTRAAYESLIPVETGLAAGIERILPELTGLLSATAMRVPVSNVSAIDLTLNLKNTTTVAELNEELKRAAVTQYNGVLGYTEEPLASCDFVHDSRSAVIDGRQTTLAGGHLAKILIWFDNEWGYANRMLDVAKAWSDLPR